MTPPPAGPQDLEARLAEIETLIDRFGIVCHGHQEPMRRVEAFRGVMDAVRSLIADARNVTRDAYTHGFDDGVKSAASRVNEAEGLIAEVHAMTVPMRLAGQSFGEDGVDDGVSAGVPTAEDSGGSPQGEPTPGLDEIRGKLAALELSVADEATVPESKRHRARDIETHRRALLMSAIERWGAAQRAEGIQAALDALPMGELLPLHAYGIAGGAIEALLAAHVAAHPAPAAPTTGQETER